ncbi:MAG: hypothetical protein AAF311_17315 [Pseudomonadota bacterium]
MNVHVGGLGDDTIIGDDYADLYVYDAGDGSDLITDKNPWPDRTMRDDAFVFAALALFTEYKNPSFHHGSV